MMRKVYGVMVAAGMLLAATSVRAQRAPAVPAGIVEAPAEMQALATPRELMLAIIIPSSKVVFTLAGDVPKDAEQWQEVRLQALALAESANLLMMPGRGPDTGAWNHTAKLLLDAASAAVKAADARNADALDSASNAIYESCDSCHNKYMAKK
jgi:cytochrome c556